MNSGSFSNKGLRVGWKDGVPSTRAILERLGDFHGAHMDLGAALYADGDLDADGQHIRRAMELGYPCRASPTTTSHRKARGDIEAMMDLFMMAAKTDPQHWVLIQNVNAARLVQGSRSRARTPLDLQVRHDFSSPRTAQHATGPCLPEDFAVWTDTPLKGRRRPRFEDPGDGGSGKGLKKRLAVLRE